MIHQWCGIEGKAYTPSIPFESIPLRAAVYLIGAIPVSARASTQVLHALIAPITDLLDASKRCPRRSCPGLDGLPYQILHLLFQHPPLQPIVEKVYNDALHSGPVPSSWSQIVASLLPKKDDLQLLAN
ncbi:hypothetical protein DM01DRAFT_1375830 [Hesseltinella vesiculosa]|uniref:Uncharacterized protein n=1 Tax=Hesseltinella vesiculosa TaxID=101127 RepID=A0A1X2GC84_9FUNG|nr:hypothetical protein DM01DRAFT_1375830 [Hesseltinella vesiculosa]